MRMTPVILGLAVAAGQPTARPVTVGQRMPATGFTGSNGTKAPPRPGSLIPPGTERINCFKAQLVFENGGDEDGCYDRSKGCDDYEYVTCNDENGKPLVITGVDSLEKGILPNGDAEVLGVRDIHDANDHRFDHGRRVPSYFRISGALKPRVYRAIQVFRATDWTGKEVDESEGGEYYSGPSEWYSDEMDFGKQPGRRKLNFRMAGAEVKNVRVLGIMVDYLDISYQRSRYDDVAYTEEQWRADTFDNTPGTNTVRRPPWQTRALASASRLLCLLGRRQLRCGVREGGGLCKLAYPEVPTGAAQSPLAPGPL